MKKALFFGDSNTYGYDPAGFMGGRYPRGERWTTLLQDRLEDSWMIEADGLPGRALPVTSYEWNYLRSLIRQAMPFDLFAVMLGTNDLLSTLRPDAAKTARRMNELISFVQEAAGDHGQGPAREEDPLQASGEPAGPAILIIAPPEIVLTDQSYAEPYVCGDRTYAQIYFEEGKKLSQYYGELAAYRNVLFADASEWPLAFAYDGVHLSPEGHAAFADHMAEVLAGIAAQTPAPAGAPGMTADAGRLKEDR